MFSHKKISKAPSTPCMSGLTFLTKLEADANLHFNNLLRYRCNINTGSMFSHEDSFFGSLVGEGMASLEAISDQEKLIVSILLNFRDTQNNSFLTLRQNIAHGAFELKQFQLHSQTEKNEAYIKLILNIKNEVSSMIKYDPNTLTPTLQHLLWELALALSASPIKDSFRKEIEILYSLKEIMLLDGYSSAIFDANLLGGIMNPQALRATAPAAFGISSPYGQGQASIPGNSVTDTRPLPPPLSTKPALVLPQPVAKKVGPPVPPKPGFRPTFTYRALF